MHTQFHTSVPQSGAPLDGNDPFATCVGVHQKKGLERVVGWYYISCINFLKIEIELV